VPAALLRPTAGCGIIEMKDGTPMRRAILSAVTLSAALAAGSADAWLIYPDRDDPSQWVVEIEQPYGDLVRLASLPKPAGTLVQPTPASQPILYRWRYAKEAEGMASIAVNRQGHGRIEFEFILRQPIEGQRLGAAAVLVGKDGRAMHTFYARADTVGGAFADGARHRHISLAADRSPEWWDKVDAIAFFTMRYYPQKALDDDQVWEAMRRAVAYFSKGQGTEQRG
jgi:hypothetical protein